MPDPTVRPATVDDVAAIQAVAADAWHAAYDGILGEQAVAEMLDRWYDTEGLRSSVTEDDAVFLVAGEPLCGFAQASPDESATWHLARIYVRPDEWGDGVGTALLTAVEAALRERGVDQYQLAVLADNDVGVGFYESRGFERTGADEVELAGVTVTEYWYRKEL